MANRVTFDYSKTAGYISEGEITSMKRITEDAKKLLLSREGEGNDFLGWIDLPVDYDKEEFERIQKAAAKIQSDSDVLIVLTSVQELPMNSLDIISIISFQSP